MNQVPVKDSTEVPRRERPHQALAMKVPADVSTRSSRIYCGLEELYYPFADRTVMVTNWAGSASTAAKIDFSHVFAGQMAGITKRAEGLHTGGLVPDCWVGSTHVFDDRWRAFR